MRVLITGSSGFVGHHLVSKFIDQPEITEIVGLDRLSYSGNLNRISEVLDGNPNCKKYSIIHHDLRSEINTVLCNKLGQFDYIIHVGASTHVDRSISDPMSFVLDNVVGTCNILNFARIQKNLLKFIYFSTDEVFGSAPVGVNYDEYDSYNSGNPYSATKAGGEELAVAYRNTFNVPVYITHTMNIFGPRQHSEKFVPLCIKKILSGEKIFIHSNAEKTKPGSRFYVHLEDVASAIWFVMNITDNSFFPEGKCPKFNIVGKEETTNLELATYISEALGKPLNYEFVDFHSSRPGHDLRYSLSGARMEKMGWTPSNTIKERISETVAWYLSNISWIS
jgi:dTDP-glucose 4,6-dehydratase